MIQSIEDRRIVLVDDEPVKLEGRLSWLTSAGFREITTLDFREALTYPHWKDVDTLAVDGFDDSNDEERLPWIKSLTPGDRLLELDRYMGVRVVRNARRANPDLVITVISGYVDESPELVQRFHARGANYIYSTRAAHGKDDFLQAITNPGLGRGYVRPPRSSRSANLERLLEILDGENSEWDPNVVAAVRQVLVHNESRTEVLRKAQGQPQVSPRQFNRLMDYIKDLSGLPEDTSSASDARRMRLEVVRSFVLNNLLGGKYRRMGDDRAGR